MAEERKIANLRGPAARIIGVTAETVPADQPAEVTMAGPDQGRTIHIKVPRGVSGVDGETDDAAVASYLPGTDTASGKALRSVIVGGVSATPKFLDGSRLLTAGTSISSQGTAGAQGNIWWAQAEYSSQGRLHLFASTAASGNTSRQQRDAIRALIALGGTMPTMATVEVGANNLGSGDEAVQFPIWQQDVIDIVADLRAVGCEPVLCTITPRSGGSGPALPRTPAIINGKWNAWLRRYAFENGILVADMWKAVADPATGEWRTGWADPTDGVHPFQPAHRAMAQELLATIQPLLLPTPQIPKTRRLNDGNLLAGGIITSAAMPASWLAPTGIGHTYEVDSDAPGGFAARINATNPAVNPEFRSRVLVAPGVMEVGDRISVFLMWRIEYAKDVNVGRGIRALLVHYNGGAQIGQNIYLYGQHVATDDYLMVSYDTTVAANTTEIRNLFQYDDGTSPATNEIVASLASWGFYNRTRGKWIA